MPNECDDAQMATTTRGRFAARTGRILRRRRLTASVVMAAALATSALTAATAHAATTHAALQCPAGYLCLYEPGGTIVLVPQGHSAQFPNGLPVFELNNNTNITDCLIVGGVNYRLFSSIGPHVVQVFLTPEYVFSVSPGPACPL